MELKGIVDTFLGCLDFLPPIEHPCFMRLILLRSPLLKQDPCANFSIVQDPKLKATKSRKCVKRTKTEIQFSPKVAEQNIVTNSTNNNTTEAIKTTSMESVLLAKSPPNVSKKLAIVPISQEVTNTTEEATTSTDDNSTTTFATTITEEDLTTTTLDPTTTISTSIPTTTIIPTTLSTTSSPNHLKSLRTKSRKRLGKLKGKKGKKPRVPDPPKIKLDAATQPSEVIQVIFTTEVGELKMQANETTTVSTTNVEAETTTEINLIEETTNQVETTTQETELEEEMETTETEEESTKDPFSFTEEPCNDTDEQDTNLCPQFLTPPEENEGHLPSSQLSSVRPAQRQRKVKNYVEPILYEGNFIKPRQRIGLLAQAVPQQRDYYVTDKQIMPRPKPKYRKRLPHSIYMNNIVRGLKCVDAPRPLQPYWGVKRLTSRPYAPLTYNPQRPSPPPSQSPAPFSVPVSIYHQNPNESEEDFGQEKEIVGSKSNYFDDSSSELWQGYGASNSNVDPCQLEHEHLQRRQQHIHKPPYQKVPKDDQQSVDYAHQQQQMPENFFT